MYAYLVAIIYIYFNNRQRTIYRNISRAVAFNANWHEANVESVNRHRVQKKKERKKKQVTKDIAVIFNSMLFAACTRNDARLVLG